MAYTGVDMTSKGGARLTCIGVSELVRDRIAIFVEAFEKSIEVLSPEQTELIEDHSSRFIKTYLEALLRSPLKPMLQSYIYISQHATMDALPYQFFPALQALKSPRARILMPMP